MSVVRRRHMLTKVRQTQNLSSLSSNETIHFTAVILNFKVSIDREIYFG